MRRTAALSWMLMLMTGLGAGVCADESGKTPETAALPRYNVSGNVIGVIFGAFTGRFDFGITEATTIGPHFGIYINNSVSITSGQVQIGPRLNYNLSGKRISNGLYLGIGLNYGQVSSKISGVTAKANSYRFDALAGYHLVWKSGVNLMLGLGAAYTAGQKKLTVTDSTGARQERDNPYKPGFGPLLETSVGYCF